LGKLGIDPAEGPDLVEVVKAQRERAKTLVEMANNSVFLYREPEGYDEKAAKKHLKPEIAPALQALAAALEGLADWTPEALHRAVEETARAQGLEFGKLAQPVRVAVTGRPVSPPIDVTLHLLGRERAVKRLQAAVKHITAKASG